MSYYGPAFANIQSGWYRETSDPNYAGDRSRIDAVWCPACDEVIRRYTVHLQYLFTAFDKEMLQEVEAATGGNLAGTRYHWTTLRHAHGRCWTRDGYGLHPTTRQTVAFIGVPHAKPVFAFQTLTRT